MLSCNQDDGVVTVNTYPANSNCQGTPTDVSRMPTGCFPESRTLSNFTLQMCAVNLFKKSPFHKLGQGVVTIMSPDSRTCNLAQSKAASWDAKMSVSWTHEKLNVCILPTSREAVPRMFTACSNRIVTVNTYTVGSSSCSGDPVESLPITLPSCSMNDDGLWATQICISEDGEI